MICKLYNDVEFNIKPCLAEELSNVVLLKLGPSNVSNVLVNFAGSMTKELNSAPFLMGQPTGLSTSRNIDNLNNCVSTG